MILCCGEALIDMIPAETRSGDYGFVPKSGGAVFNTAIGLGRLGADVGMFTGVSNDMFGQQLARDLTDSGVVTSHLQRSDLPSTLAFVHLNDGHATYSFFDENSAGRSLGIGDLPRDLDGVDAMFFGGISLVAEPGADSLLALAQFAAADKLIMLDPNIRPSFIEDEDRYRNRLSQLIKISDVVKISDEDLNWVVSSEDEISEKARQVLAMGPRLVLLTEGAKGVTAFSQDGEVISVVPPKVEVVDTVGAGDSFNAGFLCALDRLGFVGKDDFGRIDKAGLRACLEVGTKVAGFVVGQQGANLPWAPQID